MNHNAFSDMQSFNGPLFHTSEWDKNVNLEGKAVAIIGTGATAIQIVPSIADKVSQLYVFQRTATWSPPKNLFNYPPWVKVHEKDMYVGNMQ